VELSHRFKPQTEMEKEIESILQTSENALTDDRVLTVAEEKYLKAMSLQEAKQRHKELQKMRALLSYQEAKFKRQKKIKSKSYHRLLKKKKLEKEMKAFEEAKSKDSTKALEKLEQLDKLRALERATLRHRNSGKWSKHNQLRAKYDSTAREALREQLKLSQKLLQKIHRDDEAAAADDNDNDDDNKKKDNMKDIKIKMNTRTSKSVKKVRFDDNTKITIIKSTQNQILSDFQATQDSKQESVSKPPKWNTLIKKDIFNEKNTTECDKIENKKHNKQDKESDESNSKKDFNENVEKNEDDDEEVDQEDEEDEKSEEENINKKNTKNKDKQKNLSTNDLTNQEEDKDLNVTDFIVNESALEMMDEEDEQQQQLMAEAFAKDDVVKEFLKEKEEDIEKYKEKDICNYLPGWGSWAGPGIKENLRKKKKFTIKAEQKPRKDKNLGNVIISERKDEIIGKYMVSVQVWSKINLPY
jgi:U3 small nucleolar RNA-associated protein 14 homolog A